MGVRRLIQKDGQKQPPENVPLPDWLDYLEHRRSVILMELRYLEPVLIEYGRLKNETPRRVR